jgi:hypothetical protein
MAINFPTSLDTFTNPTATNALTSPSHSQQHSDINDAVEALEAKVAIGNTVLGTYQAYTPTVSGVTLGNATTSTRYCRVNNLVNYYGSISFGSTTTITAANWEISLPVNCLGTVPFFVPTGEAGYYDASSGIIHWGDVIAFGSSTSLRLRAPVAGQTYTTNLSSTVPFTWATSDRILFNVTYEAA